MYQKHFGLHRKPFQSVQHDADHYASEAYRQLMPAVLNALHSDLGVAVLTGPAGVGKTVTLECICRRLESDTRTAFIRGGTIRSSEDLLYALHRRLLKVEQDDTAGSSSKSVRRWDVVERLERLSSFWGPLTILLDDMHLVDADVFAELRTLLEENSDSQKLVRLLIAGPLTLEETLAQPAMGDFARRIRTHVFLEPLRQTESVEYLQHHITNAGGVLSEIFEQDALEQIAVAADGIPRCLNLLADETLMICEERGLGEVSADVVAEALARLQHLPVAWNISTIDEEDHTDPQRGNADKVVDSVVEIGASLSTDGPGVVEVGVDSKPPADTGHRNLAEADSEPTGNSPLLDIKEIDELDHGCCEFVDEDLNRDSEVIEKIAEISRAIEAADDYVACDAEEARASEEVEFAEATSTEAVNAEVVPDETQAADTITTAVIAEDIVTNDAEAADVNNREVTLTNFQPWEPAGDWPVEFGDIKFTGTEATLYALQIGDAQPVFDRYTWCELGRSVSAGAVNRRRQAKLDVSSVEWPPNLDGVVPFEAIPVLSAEGAPNDPLAELGTGYTDWLLTRGHEPGSLVTAHVADNGRSHAGEGEAFDSQLQNDEFAAHESTLNSADELITGSEHDVTALSTDNDDPYQLQSDVEANPELQGENNQEAKESMDVAALIANAVEQFINNPSAHDTSDANEDDDSAIDQITVSDEQEIRIGQDQDESGLSIAEYAPRIISDARAQVMRVLADNGGLRRAAGAENLSVSEDEHDASASDLPRLAISDHYESEAEPEETPRKSPPSFRDLFTRLRNRNR